MSLPVEDLVKRVRERVTELRARLPLGLLAGEGGSLLPERLRILGEPGAMIPPAIWERLPAQTKARIERLQAIIRERPAAKQPAGSPLVRQIPSPKVEEEKAVRLLRK